MGRVRERLLTCNQMTTFFLYLMKSVLCLTLFYPFYMVLLSRETFHRFNRMALISILLASVVIPACRITTEEPMLLSQLYQRWEHWLTGQDAETTTATIDVSWSDMDLAVISVAEADIVPMEPAFSLGEFLSEHWGDLLFLLYIGGILFLLVRHVASLVRLFSLLKQGRMQRLEDGTRLYLHPQSDIAPFSWMKYIVISETDYRENGRQIVAHEQAHISNHHSWDLLLVEVCLLAQWFNPAAWLLRQELQNIHEYEADDTVLRRGINAKEYQLLIIKKAVGARLYSLANSLNHSSLKKRLTMMMKEKSHPWARLKYLYVLPLAAISMVAFAHTEAANNSNGVSEAKGTEVLANNQTLDEKSNEKFTVHVNNAGEYSYGRMGGTLKKGSLDDVANYIQTERRKLTEAGGGQYLAVNVKLDNNAPKESFEKLKETLRNIYVLRISYHQSTEGRMKMRFRLINAETDEPVYGANVVVRGTGRGTVSDKEGRFEIEFDPSKEVVNVSYVGMQSVSIKMADGQVPYMEHTIRMHPTEFTLDMLRTEDMENVDHLKLNGSVRQNQEEHLEFGDAEPVFMVVEEMPEFPGGNAELMKYLVKNLNYPAEAKQNGEQGRVIVSFTVGKDGKLRDVEVKKGISPALDAEAVRVIKAMPTWKPGRQRGMAVDCKYNIPISFSLESEGIKSEEQGDIRIIGKGNVKAVYDLPVEQDNNSTDEVFQVVENMPEFPGGMAELMKFISKNIKYPEQAMRDSIQGRVIVQFTIKKTGEVSNPTIMRSVSPELDAEAIRVVNAMPTWKPGTQRGQAVNVKFTLPIQFRLASGKGKSTQFTTVVNGQSIVVESQPTTRAQYPEGREAMLNFFQNRLRLDKNLSDKVEEHVLLQAFISSEGKLIGYTDITRKNHLKTPDALIQEAHRVADLLPKEGWTPAVLNGKPVNGSVAIPVSFRFEKES